jgi:beta-mannosidase
MELMQERSLNGTLWAEPHGEAWELRDEILTYDLANARALGHTTEGWIPTAVPGDIHQGLVAAGRIAEPLLGLNSFDCRWTEERSWWFRKRFELERELEWLNADVVELELNGLDSNAEVFLNGYPIGSHRNAFRPFIADVKPRLRSGENILLVRLTAGVEDVSEADIDAPDGVRANTEDRRDRPERGDPRRVMVRKPQYSFGWDWSPRVATTAIAGDVTLRAIRKACIRHVRLVPTKHRSEALVRATVTVDQLHYYMTAEGRVKVTLIDAQGRQFSAERDVLLRSGHTYVEMTLPIADPQWWWPNGLGAQHLYHVQAELEIEGERAAYPAFEWGMRTVELDTRDKFAVVVNGVKVFCKGANWIPADAVYARVSDERYEALIREARDANFTMLRIWGGGLYERDAFYRACDRYGIMIWHDFMFACAPYPDHLDWFRQEVAQEADYQTRRLQRHACMVLWSGSNENNWGFRDWWDEQTRGGAWTYNYCLPDAVQRNCPEIPYWNGSPYGGDEPNSSDVGDRHHWHDCMMNPDMQKRITPEEYDKCTSLFVSEFGYIGPPALESILTYMDGAPLDRQSRVWQHHNNTFEQDTVEAGIRKHYADPENLTLSEYLLYSGLCQGLMYSYALDSMRYRENCHGSLFWMYDDTWGEVGWTIIDYYLRHKLSWWFVRRAYAPLRLIARSAEQGAVRVVLANDTQDEVSFEVEYGYVSLDGALADLQRHTVHAPPLARTELCVLKRGTHNPTRGLWIARALERPEISPAIYRAVDYRQLETGDPRLACTVTETGERSCTVRASAQGYAHAVHLDLPTGAVPSDDYFDLLPGTGREIQVVSSEPLDTETIGVTCVNAR